MDPKEEVVTWKCWCKIDSKKHFAWEFIYTISVIYLSIAITYMDGTWNMATFVNEKEGIRIFTKITSIVILFDMVMQIITEKKISEEVVLKRIPDVANYYLKR